MPKIVGKRREREKIRMFITFHSVSTLRVIENSKKIAKKIQKTKQHYYGFISGQNRFEKAEKEKKYKLSFRFVPTQRVIQNSKNISKKIQKTKQYHYGFILSQNWLENGEKKKK